MNITEIIEMIIAIIAALGGAVGGTHGYIAKNNNRSLEERLAVLETENNNVSKKLDRIEDNIDEIKLLLMKGEK